MARRNFRELQAPILADPKWARRMTAERREAEREIAAYQHSLAELLTPAR
jgi:hypothetical protein